MKGNRLLSVFLSIFVLLGTFSHGEDDPSFSIAATPALPDASSEEALDSSVDPSSEPAVRLFVPSAVAFLHNRIDAILNANHLRSTEWSVLIQDLNSNQTIFSINPKANLMPASNRKLFTTALALVRLGPDFRFATSLYLDGQKTYAKRFNGDLVIVARGDPTFSARWSEKKRADERFCEWADLIRQNGITHIRNVVIDISAFPASEKFPGGWKDNQLDRSYSAPVSAFSFNENVVTVNVKPGAKIASACRVSLEPVEGDFRIENRTRTVGSTRRAIFASRLGTENAIEVRGTLGREAKVCSMVVAVADPPPFAGDAVIQALEARGVHVLGKLKIVETPFQPTSQTIALPDSLSPPLCEIVKEVNRDSNNFMAEHLYKAVGLQIAGNGSYDSARQVEDEFLTEVGIDPQTVSFDDGCGLSPLNQVNSGAIITLLKYMDRHPCAEVFKDSLPTSGENGSLRHRMDERLTRGKLHAKTGFIRGASALSGYLDCPDGTQLVLSILGNFRDGANTRIKAQDEICRELLKNSLLKEKPRSNGSPSPQPTAKSTKRSNKSVAKRR